MSSPNGRVPVDVKSLLVVGGMIVSVAVAWGVNNARASAMEDRVEKLESRSEASAQGDAQQDLALAVIQSTVSDLKATVGEIKGQQQAFQQSTDAKLNSQDEKLNKILWELRSGRTPP